MDGDGDVCWICSRPVGRSPMACGDCSQLGFVTDPVCSDVCLDQVHKRHADLHRARPRSSSSPSSVSPALRASCGRCLVATRDIAIGDIVLRERPILSGSWRDCNDAFAHGLSDQERDRILAFAGADDDEIADDAEHIARMCIPKEEFDADTDNLVQILHNNSIDVGKGRCALFEWGSLVAHSCRPNVDGAIIIDDDDATPIWELRALRPIRQGELLGWNYNVSMRAMMQGTARRRAELLDLRGFVCGCDACESIDWQRSFRCRLCPEGIVAGHHRLRSQAVLACQSCRLVVDGDELEDEERLERSLYLAMEDDPEWRELAARAHDELGPYHGITGSCMVEAAALMDYDDLDRRLALERIDLFLSSTSLVDAVVVHEYVRDRLSLGESRPAH